MKILGTTDERTDCECCGRTNLKGTVAIQFDDHIAYYGSTCASKAIGWDTESTKTAIRDADAAKAKEAARVRNIALNARAKAQDAFDAATFPGISDRVEAIAKAGGYASYMKAFRESKFFKSI